MAVPAKASTYSLARLHIAATAPVMNQHSEQDERKMSKIFMGNPPDPIHHLCSLTGK